MKLFLVVLLSLTLLSGCSWTRDIQIKTKPVERIPLVLPEADLYHHRSIEWVVITKENAAAVFAQLAKEGKPIAIIGLAGDDYELLALNTNKTYYIAVEKRDKDAVTVVE